MLADCPYARYTHAQELWVTAYKKAEKAKPIINPRMLWSALWYGLALWMGLFALLVLVYE